MCEWGKGVGRIRWPEIRQKQCLKMEICSVINRKKSGMEFDGKPESRDYEGF